MNDKEIKDRVEAFDRGVLRMLFTIVVSAITAVIVVLSTTG